MPSQPSPDTTKIKQLCAEGYQAYDLADYSGALRLFYQAWLLVPKPQTEWVEAGWVLTAIGDAYFKSKQFPQAIEALRSALHCPDIDDNPFVELRLGQALLDQGQAQQARKHLQSCFNKVGRSIFEQEAPRYLNEIAELINT
ncbi:hypothetical protein R50073_23160 [Maricurvus nonylphenolicus]|uniref:tetratricopeptide repeat protein n=1 Tax=Maricurvus nonylphenolicus TaxID=1008307 RepID=UPI0036F24886